MGILLAQPGLERCLTGAEVMGRKSLVHKYGPAG